MHTRSLARRNVLFMSWRDIRNPEGGGAEVYLEQVARGLQERGASVTIFSAAHAGAPPEETRDGIRYVHRGSKMGVYAQGILSLARRRFGKIDLIVDVQNGLPFFSQPFTSRPSVVLVHHVHREQWPVVYPGLAGRVGWWIERWLAPRLYRRSRYVVVSRATSHEIQTLGVDGDRITVVHNGNAPAPPVNTSRNATPTICVLGRLVPHKQVEHAIAAAKQLEPDFPGLKLLVIGDGWWGGELRDYTVRLGATHLVDFRGHVEEQEKHELLAQSWVMALPSLKEGWGLVVGEAGLHGTPTVAYRSAGGTQESISDRKSGLLVDTEAEFVNALRRILADSALRAELSSGAQQMSHKFTWDETRRQFSDVVLAALND